MKFYSLLYCLLAFHFLISCEDGNSFSDDYKSSLRLKPYLYLLESEATIEFGENASSREIGVKYSSKYTVQTSANWVTATPSADGNLLTISVSDNSSTKVRNATVTLTNASDNLNIIIPVTQDGKSTFSYTVSANSKTVTFNMKYVEAGSFIMGTPNDEGREIPHKVTLSNDYYIGETEVTQGLWSAVFQELRYNTEYGYGDDYPAYNISYDDVNSFLRTLNYLLADQLPSGMKFRMPTEAEWEFAARGGNKSKGYTYAGSNTIGDVAWYTVNACDVGRSSINYGTHQVKTKAPNELGIYDMSGNVTEWCLDWFSNTFYQNSPEKDPVNSDSPSAELRIQRGGCWLFDADGCSVSSRFCRQPTYTAQSEGFRLALGY